MMDISVALDFASDVNPPPITTVEPQTLRPPTVQTSLILWYEF